MYFFKQIIKVLPLLLGKKTRDAITTLLNSKDSYLRHTGWIQTWATPGDVTLNGEPSPWMTYPFLHFLETRLRPHFHVFEFGSGASTHYYAKRVARVDSVEHDAHWTPKLSEEEAQKVNIYIIPLTDRDRYTHILHTLKRKYQMIVVDGRYRVRCVLNAAEHLDSSGVLILDDTRRAYYNPAIEHMLDRGFKRLDFYGIKATGCVLDCTTIFYREGNCLQL